MAKIGYPDKPVISKTEDLFRVETYIDGLCRFIKECDTPMTISIQGDWGSGKTSMMNMIRENIEDEICTVWFNTWQFSQFSFGNSLVFSMMTVLLNELGCEKDTIKKVIGGVAGFAKNFAVGMVDHAVGGFVADKVNDVLSPDVTIDYANEVTQLKEKFQVAVNHKIKTENKNRVVIFVDDLDRLQPAKAIELLEVLKLFLDCENCVFVLAVDYEVVTLGIKQKFGNDVSEEKGKSFFDKIIQLPFKMPVAQYDIKQYVQNALSSAGIDCENNLNLFIQLIQTSVGFNPRSMKRLFNTFQLLGIISKATLTNIDDAVRQRILFAIICMQSKYDGLYKYFVSVPGALESDSIEVFRGEDAIKKINEDKELLELISDNHEDQDGWISKITKFMDGFIRAIQLDEDESISEHEIEVLKQILKCSMITSVNNMESENESDQDRSYRWENRQIAKNVNELLKKYGEIKLWLPRKAREGTKLSDVCGYTIFHAKDGFDFSVEYYIVRDDRETISVDILLRDKSKNAQYFFEHVGVNPLAEIGLVGKKYDWGGIDYEYVLKVSANASDIPEQIAAIWEKAFLEMKRKYID